MSTQQPPQNHIKEKTAIRNSGCSFLESRLLFQQPHRGIASSPTAASTPHGLIIWYAGATSASLPDYFGPKAPFFFSISSSSAWISASILAPLEGSLPWFLAWSVTQILAYYAFFEQVNPLNSSTAGDWQVEWDLSGTQQPPWTFLPVHFDAGKRSAFSKLGRPLESSTFSSRASLLAIDLSSSAHGC